MVLPVFGSVQVWRPAPVAAVREPADALAADLDSVLGTAWDESLEPYRGGGDTGEVSWLNRGVG